MSATLRLKILAGVILSFIGPGFVSPAWANPTVLNFISDIKGDVRLKRSEWNDYQKANFGDLLHPSDQLELSAGASATVMCDNSRVWVVPAGKESLVSDGCGSRQPRERRPNNRRSPSRAPNETIPYIISPRNTTLVTNRPILRWNAVPGATRYTVLVQDAGLTLDWKTETSNTEIDYSGPPLQPDSYYLVTVETNTGKSSEEEQGADLSFTLLDAQSAESLKTEVAQLKQQLKQQPLTQEAEGLGLAYLYQRYDLNAKAIELLEGLVKQETQIVAVYQLLGDLYQQVGLSQQAKSPYLQALELAKQTENVEGQAKAQVGLGQVEGKKTEAIEWLTQAQTNYQTLGDQSKVEEVQQWIKDLQ
ncbi:tetratricopeptide repeat protein [Moorena sp. SIO3B2]|uniref:tetratricopeptide repeat protein n=1 Tax=Moorena sp. SIO3B2 TaxID=2607827 RepID=UPI0013C89698|nr:tetratricopeptide repeat protein [Moorena sp. SIO3B2]NEP35734.1 tetratricopeptide repeat protein [Moorena sp. SIO3B2]